ncbi:cation transporter, partial [Streptomyces sp. AC154]|uniref:cation transporter n=1 Tax=Streptomyces sp. AC154 TaxID=3143184 RepID=UPI003F7F93ED
MHSATETEAPAAESSEAEFMIGGMTCASCAARVEKKLNRMDGVTATVNYATEKARVLYGPETGVADLIATVRKTGYTAEPLHRPAPATAPPSREATPTPAKTKAPTEAPAAATTPAAPTPPSATAATAATAATETQDSTDTPSNAAPD